MNALTLDREGIFYKRGAPGIDRRLLIFTITLAILGTLMIISAGEAYAEFRYSDPLFFPKRQIVWLILGIFTMLIASRIRPAAYRAVTPYLYFVTLLLLVAVLIFGMVGNGAQRWISIGPITIQPSEIAKLAIIMALGLYFERQSERALDIKSKKSSFVWGTLLPVIIMGVPILLVMLEKHLSCIIILGIIGLLIIIASGVDIKYIGIFAIIALIGVGALALFTDYTKERITVWQNPELYKLTGGWQTLQGLMAIGSGGLFGLGYGNGIMKLCYVSEPANDMIFAIVCEELGFVGAVLTLFIFFITVKRLVSLSLRSEGIFERLVTFGIGAKIATQTLLNVAVVTNTIPNTGISLPFFSYGGSSLIMLFFEIGMVLSFSRTARITK